MPKPYDYTIFNDFIEKLLLHEVEGVNRQDELILELEKKLMENQQFIYIADLLQMQVLFTSAGSQNLIGVDPVQFDLSSLISRVHPIDFKRHSLARSMVIKKGYELLMRRRGISIISTHSHVRNKSGAFTNLLFQAYSFYREVPTRTVYVLLVLTDLSSFHINKHGYHYYIGDNPIMFRYPDEALLREGHIFSDREFEIIKLIAAGLGSEQIADKLSLSVSTVNTHRRNILKKTKKSTTHDLVIDLLEKGIL